MGIENTIDIQHHHDSNYTLGKKQWEILESLEQKYAAMDISDVTENQFTDGSWTLTSDGDTKTLYFDKHLAEPTDLPVKMCLKILVITLIREAKYQPGTINGPLTSFLTTFMPKVRQMTSPVLLAPKGSRWLPMSELAIADIAYILESIALSGVANNIQRALGYMEAYQHTPDLAPFLEGLITPWTHEGITREQWMNNLQLTTDTIKEKKPYAALPDETVSQLINSAMPYMEGVSADVDLETVFESDDVGTDKLTDILRQVKTLAYKYHDKAPNAKAVSISKNDEFNALILSLGTRLDEMKLSPANYLRKSKNKFYNDTIGGTWFTMLFENAQIAAIWMLALTTGLRNTDIRHLKYDCLHYSDRFKLWFIKAYIQKTNITIHIPVGDPTVKAVKLLQWLAKSPNKEYLIELRSSPVSKVSPEKRVKLGSGGTLNRRLIKFAAFYGISLNTISEDDDEATCHCIRATLAAYIGRHSTLAVLILKKLFGHSNNLMPDQYIRHNVFVRQKREEQLAKMQSDDAYEIALSLANKEVAGIKGDELLKGAAHLEEQIRLENESLTEMDVHKKLTDILYEIILNDMKNEQTQTLLTPMAVICMRATNHSTDSPCAANTNKAERDKAGISRAMFSAASQLPNPSQCIGLDCPDALATKKHSLPLLQQFDWYTNVYRQCTADKHELDEDAKHFVETYYPILMANNLLTEAESFRKKYGPTLRQLYAGDKPEGYFDV